MPQEVALNPARSAEAEGQQTASMAQPIGDAAVDAVS